MIFISTKSPTLSKYLESFLLPKEEEAGVPNYNGEFFIPDSYFVGFNKKKIFRYLFQFLKFFGPMKVRKGRNIVLDIFWSNALPNDSLKKLFYFYSL